MGTGSSAGAVVQHGGVRLDILEIVPELRDLLPCFADVNAGLATRLERDPTVRLFATDARQYVRGTEHRYDVVVGDLFVPWRAGEGAMYTREHFAAVRDVLAEGGLFCQWLPLYQLRPEDLRTIVATFLDVFPATSMWWLYFNVEQPVVGLVGSVRERELDLADLDARLRDPGWSAVLARDGLDRIGPLAGSRIADAERLAAWVGDTPVETAARPRIEFSAPRHHLARAASPAAENVPEILALVDAPPPGAETGLAAEAAAHRRALVHLFTGLYAERWEDDRERAIEELAQALEQVPDWTWLQVSLDRLAR